MGVLIWSHKPYGSKLRPYQNPLHSILKPFFQMLVTVLVVFKTVGQYSTL